MRKKYKIAVIVAAALLVVAVIVEAIVSGSSHRAARVEVSSEKGELTFYVNDTEVFSVNHVVDYVAGDPARLLLGKRVVGMYSTMEEGEKPSTWAILADGTLLQFEQGFWLLPRGNIFFVPGRQCEGMRMILTLKPGTVTYDGTIYCDRAESNPLAVPGDIMRAWWSPNGAVYWQGADGIIWKMDPYEEVLPVVPMRVTS